MLRDVWCCVLWPQLRALQRSEETQSLPLLLQGLCVNLLLEFIELDLRGEEKGVNR